MTDPMMSRPDWVIIGVKINEQVMVLASTDLNTGELEAVRDEMEDYWPDIMFRPTAPMLYRLTVEMGRYVIITAPDYQTAMEHLFRSWTPETTQPRGITDRTRP